MWLSATGGDAVRDAITADTRVRVQLATRACAGRYFRLWPQREGEERRRAAAHAGGRLLFYAARTVADCDDSRIGGAPGMALRRIGAGPQTTCAAGW